MAEIQPLVQITGIAMEHPRELGITVSHYEALCRDCGAIQPPLAIPQSVIQAGLLRDRHLAEHLTALAQEIKEAAR